MAAGVRGTREDVKGRRSLPIYAALDINLVKRRLGSRWLMRARRARSGECQRLSSSERVSPMVTMRLALGLLPVGLTVLIIEADTSAAFSYYYGPLQSFLEGLSLRLAIQCISVRCEIVPLLGRENGSRLPTRLVLVFGNYSFRLKALFPHDWRLFSGFFRVLLDQNAILDRPQHQFPPGDPGPLVRIISVDLK